MQRNATELLAIRPLTEEEKKRGLEVLKRAQKLRAKMLRRRNGKLVPSSTPLIRQSREED